MSSNKGFDNQLFISYTHIDNRDLMGATKGWIDLLHERLEIRLAQLLGKPPKIWRDGKLRGFDDFNETLVIELSRSAILISIVSPRYIESDSCKSEVENFFRLAKQSGGVQINDKRRVFRVVKTFVPYKDHPIGLQDLLPYEFYELNEASGRSYEFDHVIGAGGDRDKRYWNKFEDLAWDVHELIKYIEDPPQKKSTPTGATIYLAETTSDLSEERDKVKRELAQFGHVVLPDKALPMETSALKTAVRDYLVRSRLSVHLIGENYGIIPEKESEKSIARLQQELAVERGDDSQFSRLIWLPPGLEPTDERQRKFVADLQHSFGSHNGSELLQVRFEDLKTIIQTKLTLKANLAHAPSEATDVLRIYLICDRQDVEAADPIRAYLFQQGCEVTLPLVEGSAIEALEDHKENLLYCDAVVIFQGGSSDAWLRMKMRELVKLPGYGRKAPLLGKAICLAAPETPSKKSFQTRETTLIKDFGVFDPAAIQPFLDEVLNKKGGSQ